MTVSFIVFIVGIILAVPLRLWQYNSLIEPETGFYIQDGFKGWSIYLIFFVVAILILFFSHKDKRILSRPFSRGTMALGFSFLAVSTVLALSFGEKIKDDFISTSGNFQSVIINNIFQIICVLLFTILSFMIISGKNHGSAISILALVPVIWAVSMLWRTYTRYKTILTISEHLLDVASYVFISLFFLSFANVIAGFGGDGYQKKTIFFGLTSATLCLTNSVGKIYSVFYTGYKLVPAVTESGFLLDITISILMIICSIYLIFGKDEIPESNIYEEEDIPLPKKAKEKYLSKNDTITSNTVPLPLETDIILKDVQDDSEKKEDNQPNQEILNNIKSAIDNKENIINVEKSRESYQEDTVVDVYENVDNQIFSIIDNIEDIMEVDSNIKKNNLNSNVNIRIDESEI